MKKFILQLLEWEIKDIIVHLKDFKSIGYNYIQISPMQPTKDTGKEWWKLYQPLGFSIGNTQIGTKEELKSLCLEANKLGIKIIVDVVVNHTASQNNNPLEPHELVDKELTSRPEFWKEKRFIQNWTDRNEVISYSNGLPCLKLENHDLQNIIIIFLDELVRCGVAGFRIDSAKSIALPEDKTGSLPNGSDFWKRVFGKYINLFIYAEVIFESSELIDEYNKYVNVTTSHSGSDKSKIISYAENHDSFLDDIIGYTKNKSNEEIFGNWANIVDQYDNILYYARPYDCGWASNKIRDTISKYRES